MFLPYISLFKAGSSPLTTCHLHLPLAPTSTGLFHRVLGIFEYSATFGRPGRDGVDCGLFFSIGTKTIPSIPQLFAGLDARWGTLWYNKRMVSVCLLVSCVACVPYVPYVSRRKRTFVCYVRLCPI